MSEELKNQDVELKETNVDQPQEQNNNIEENFKQMSPMKLIFRRFFRSKLSIVGLIILVFLFLFAFLGPVIYNKWGETEVDRTQVAQIYTEEKTVINEYGEEITIIQEIEIFTDNLKASPSKDHLLGTDEKGMAIFIYVKVKNVVVNHHLRMQVNMPIKVKYMIDV